MNLKQIEKIFNSSFNINLLRQEAELYLKRHLVNSEIISEFSQDLPNGASFQELQIQYKDIVILLNDSVRKLPIFRVRYILRYMDRDIFWYDMECDLEGVMIDDYFDSFTPVRHSM